MNERPLVLTTSPLHPAVEQQLASFAQVRTAPAADPATLLEAARDVDVVIVRDPLPAALFADCPRLRAVVRHGAGVDYIPVAQATRAGILVAVVPGANARSVAEHVMLVTLALSRRLLQTDSAIRQVGWSAGRALAVAGRELGGATLGLVGTGNVGRAVAEIAGHGFGMRVIGARAGRRPMPEPIEARPLPELFAESDVLVLACPLTEHTRNLLDHSRLALLRPHALVVNVARGPVIDDNALIDALRRRRIGGAALDVFVDEPLPADHPYWGLDNVLLTPHAAAITDDSLRRMGLGAVDRARTVLAGGIPDDLVNPEVLTRYADRQPRALL